MGLQLCTPVGSGINMQRILIASCLTVSTLADPGLVGGNVLVGPGGLSPAWPAVAGLGVESTCFGCRPLHIVGKRSAEPGLFAAGYGFTNGPASVSAVGNHFASNYGVSQLHPGPASSFQRVDRLHKRSAEPFAVGVGILNNNLHGPNHFFGTTHGISQPHPGLASSFQHTT